MGNQNQFNLNKGIPTSIGILIIIVFAALVGGILAWQFEWLKKEAQVLEREIPEVEIPEAERQMEIPEVEIPEAERQEEVITNEIANWKTYRNEEYGFEFRYPKEITFSYFSTSRYVFSMDSWTSQKRDKNKPAIGLFISLLRNSGEQMLKEQKDLWSRQTDERLEIQEVKIGKTPGLIVKNVRMIVSDMGGGVARISSVELNTFNYKYFYSFQCSQDGDNWDKCEQIISTFRFLE